MKQNTETLGSRLRKLRTDKKLSQDAVAEAVGIGKGYLSDVERNKVKPGSINLKKLAKFFEVTTDWLLTGKDAGAENVYEPTPVYTCEVTFNLPDPSNELVENMKIFREILEHGDPQIKAWLEGQIKWMAWKLENW